MSSTHEKHVILVSTKSMFETQLFIGLNVKRKGYLARPNDFLYMVTQKIKVTTIPNSFDYFKIWSGHHEFQRKREKEKKKKKKIIG